MQVFSVRDYKGLCLRSVSSSHVLRTAEGTQHAVGSAKGGTRSELYNNAFSFTPGKQFEKHKTLKNNCNSKSLLYDQSLTHSSGIIRDGPLETLWGGGGEFSSRRSFFSLSNSMYDFFRP